MKKLSFPFHGLGLKLFLLLSILTIFVFVIIIYINTEFYTDQIESNIRDHAVQASNLIKQSLHDNMLGNEREELAIVISNIGKEQYIDNIRIFKKEGRIVFATDPNELNVTFDKKREQCIICHTSDQAKGIIPEESQFRERRSPVGDRIIGLINPIENEPVCYNAACHAHNQDEKLLGYLDIKISLKDLEKRKETTRTRALIFSGILILLSTIVLGRIIRNQIQRPISKLVDGMHHVADLDLDYAVDVDATDDIKDMALTFNKMTQKLKKAQQELQQWSNDLENKVKEKTRELENSQRQMIFVEKMASMGKLAAVVAHEINNPMSGILTYAKLLIKKIENNPSQEIFAEVVENLKIIRDESKRCGDIVQNLLTFSKTSNGEKTESDLKSILDKSIELVQHKLEMIEAKLIKDFTSEDTTMYCDPSAIQQIVVALLINAYEALPQKGGEVKIGLFKDNVKNIFRLEVSDNGVGIPEDVMPRIFEPFYTTKDASRNTGLGLAVVYGNVRRCGGSIDVKTKVNEGTTFIINMPIKSS
jgi:two-component system NtrC family sensor kinase